MTQLPWGRVFHPFYFSQRKAILHCMKCRSRFARHPASIFWIWTNEFATGRVYRHAVFKFARRPYFHARVRHFVRETSFFTVDVQIVHVQRFDETTKTRSNELQINCTASVRLCTIITYISEKYCTSLLARHY